MLGQVCAGDLCEPLTLSSVALLRVAICWCRVPFRRRVPFVKEIETNKNGNGCNRTNHKQIFIFVLVETKPKPDIQGSFANCDIRSQGRRSRLSLSCWPAGDIVDHRVRRRIFPMWSLFLSGSRRAFYCLGVLAKDTVNFLRDLNKLLQSGPDG